MSLPLITQGDATSHGGTVLTGSVLHRLARRPIACVGDAVSCPVPGHGMSLIVSGDMTVRMGGRAVARHGDRCACGATLLSSQWLSRGG